MLGAESFCQTHFSERARLGCHANFLFDSEMTWTIDDEALGDECSDGKGTNGMLSNNMKDKMSAGQCQ